MAIACESGATKQPAPVRDKPVVLSIEFPELAEQLRAPLRIHILNKTQKNLRILKGLHALNVEQISVRLYNADGTPIPPAPIETGPPAPPKEEDYLIIGPGEEGSVDLSMSVVLLAYSVRPQTLYFVKLIVTPEGFEPVETKFPFGYVVK
jgi:hypothetical protein